jgi:hypothetical protein
METLTPSRNHLKSVCEIVEDSLVELNEYKLHPRPTISKKYLDLRQARSKKDWYLVGKMENNDKFMDEVDKFIEQMLMLENKRVGDLEHLKWVLENMDQNDFRRHKVEVKIQELSSDCFYIRGVGCQLTPKVNHQSHPDWEE